MLGRPFGQKNDIRYEGIREMIKFHNILFDLDGTLTDPVIGITKSVQYSLEKLGIIEPNTEKLIGFIGPPLWESYKRYYGFDDSKSNLAVRYYREYFGAKGIFENVPYDGIEDILSKLNVKKRNVFIATSKPAVYSRRIAEHFDMTKYFVSIEGSELDGRLSNKVELIKHIMEKYNINQEETIMIGDREHDIIGAKNNGIQSIGVGYGYGTKEELKKAGATYYVESVNELKMLLMNEDA